jgi:hypothetical protein
MRLERAVDVDRIAGGMDTEGTGVDDRSMDIAYISALSALGPFTQRYVMRHRPAPDPAGRSVLPAAMAFSQPLAAIQRAKGTQLDESDFFDGKFRTSVEIPPHNTTFN